MIYALVDKRWVSRAAYDDALNAIVAGDDRLEAARAEAEAMQVKMKSVLVAARSALEPHTCNGGNGGCGCEGSNDACRVIGDIDEIVSDEKAGV